MTALTGTFSSPYYPQDYKNHASCKWQIAVHSNYTISVNFDDVILERTCCQCDYIEVWETLKNGSAVLIAKFCDDTKPDSTQQFRSTGNRMTIVFRSDATVQDKGFKASYRAIPVPGKKNTDNSTSRLFGIYACILIPNIKFSMISFLDRSTIEPFISRRVSFLFRFFFSLAVA